MINFPNKKSKLLKSYSTYLYSTRQKDQNMDITNYQNTISCK